MALEKATVRMVGKTPVLMHHVRLANPLGWHFQELQRLQKKKKARGADKEALLKEMARVEWEGGMYFSKKYGPIMPSHCLRACFREGARIVRGGKDVERGLTFPNEFSVLEYAGPREIEPLWQSGPKHLENWDAGTDFVDITMVKVGTGRVPRCRPIFRAWALKAECWFDTRVLNADDLLNYMNLAGGLSRLGDGRTAGFGMFDVSLM